MIYTPKKTQRKGEKVGNGVVYRSDKIWELGYNTWVGSWGVCGVGELMKCRFVGIRLFFLGHLMGAKHSWGFS
jgi:hypothetical protein